MKTNRIVPAALAATLIVAGGASQALAESDLAEHQGPLMVPAAPMHQSTSKDMSTQLASTGTLSQSSAEQKAMQAAGGGKVIASDVYGSGKDMYWFDIQNGDSIKRVYVNGQTGKVAVLDATTFGFHHDNNTASNLK